MFAYYMYSHNVVTFLTTVKLVRRWHRGAESGILFICIILFVLIYNVNQLSGSKCKRIGGDDG